MADHGDSFIKIFVITKNAQNWISYWNSTYFEKKKISDVSSSLTVWGWETGGRGEIPRENTFYPLILQQAERFCEGGSWPAGWGGVVSIKIFVITRNVQNWIYFLLNFLDIFPYSTFCVKVLGGGGVDW